MYESVDFKIDLHRYSVIARAGKFAARYSAAKKYASAGTITSERLRGILFPESLSR